MQQLKLSYVSQDKLQPSCRTQDIRFICTHARSFPGLDACYCADCGKSISAGTKEYNELMRKYRIAEDILPMVKELPTTEAARLAQMIVCQLAGMPFGANTPLE